MYLFRNERYETAEMMGFVSNLEWKSVGYGKKDGKDECMRFQGRLRGVAALLLSCAALLIAALLLSLSEWLTSVASGICLWGIYPLAGALAAYGATLHGVNNYLAWLPAPAMITLGHWLIWGYLPSAGQMLLSALLGIIGAATGETKKQFDRRKGR